MRHNSKKLGRKLTTDRHFLYEQAGDARGSEFWFNKQKLHALRRGSADQLSMIALPQLVSCGIWRKKWIKSTRILHFTRFLLSIHSIYSCVVVRYPIQERLLTAQKSNARTRQPLNPGGAGLIYYLLSSLFFLLIPSHDTWRHVSSFSHCYFWCDKASRQVIKSGRLKRIKNPSFHPSYFLVG